VKRIAGWAIIGALFAGVFALNVARYGVFEAAIMLAISLLFGAAVTLACWLILAGDATSRPKKR
jgi:hypothetical protein